jgi:hypothetical protein
MMLPTQMFDLGTAEALCFFTNLYHTLLLHARMVLGLPTAQNWAMFFSRYMKSLVLHS